MKSEDVAIMVNVAFSVVELLARLQKENPTLFMNQEVKVQELKKKVSLLEDRPEDYLQTWKP